MAESSMINRLFESVPDDIIFAFNGLYPVEWDDKYFDAMEIYKVPKLTAGDITNIFKSLSDEMMMTEWVEGLSLNRLLCLAMNIRHPTEEKGRSRLLDEFPDGNINIEAGLSSIPHTISSYDIKYATFICAFILKLITKTPENVVNSWTTCHNRFKGFYPRTQTKTQAVPTVEWLQGIKARLDNDKMCKETVLKFIQSLEKQHPDADSKEAVLCKYLFSDPLSYAGMHAYKLFIDVKAVSGTSDQFLLNALRRTLFNSALDEIAKILTKFESTTSEAKSTKFKYARLVGSQYFMALQTKNCPGLVFCLASILKYHPQSQPGSSNPENIHALRTLATSLKADIDMIAQRIVQAMTPEAQVMKPPAQFISGRGKDKSKEVRDPFA